MAFGMVAALHNRNRGGGGRHIDFSMLEGLLWTMPDALVAAQTGSTAEHYGNGHPEHAPHNVFRAHGEDAWLAIGVTCDAEWAALCRVVPGLAEFSVLGEAERRELNAAIEERIGEWAASREPIVAMELLQVAGVPASASYTTNDLFGDAHLWERGLYHSVLERDGTPRMLPGLPWRWGDESLIQPKAAPALGQHSQQVLRDLAGLTDSEIEALRMAGALGAKSEA
jgi:benzylsuccinate CoA-transferase BbsF subunit